MARAFYGDNTFKQAVLARMRSLDDDGFLEPGQEFDAEEPSALIHQLVLHRSRDPYGDLANLLGMPHWFVRAYVALFESLSSERAGEWAITTLVAIPLGADFTRVEGAFYSGLVDDNVVGVLTGVRDQRVLEVGRSVSREILSAQLVDCDDGMSPGFLWPRAHEHLERVKAIQRDYGRRAPYPEWTALSTIAWVCLNRPVNAMLTGVAHNGGCVSGALLWWERLRLRPGVLCGAVPTAFGTVGYAYKANRARQIDATASWFLRIARSIPSDTSAPGFPEDWVGLKRGGHTRDEQFQRVALPDGPVAKSPTWPSAILRHVLLISTGGLALLAGWSLAVSVPFCLGTMDTCLPYDSGASRMSVLLGMILIARLLISIGRRTSAGGGWYAIQRNPNGYVLYLRSFEDDAATTTETTGTLFDFFVPSPPLEAAMIEAFRPIGPVVALGSAGRPISTIGTSKIRIRNNEWRATICAMMRNARLIVIMPGLGRGIRDELSWIRQLVEPRKVVFYVPDELWARHIFYYEDRESRRFVTFLHELLSEYLGARLSDRCSDYNILWLNRGWNAHPLGLGVEAATGGTAARYADAISPLYDYFGVTPPARLEPSRCLTVVAIIIGGFYLPRYVPSIVSWLTLPFKSGIVHTFWGI